MEAPRRMARVKNGWTAYGDGWGVFGETEQEALRNYEEAIRRHAIIDRRGDGGLSHGCLSRTLPSRDGPPGTSCVPG